ncbi:MlaD family protein [uncultured Litoreibacter sp.]|uniref:PqiB family protein n=1 Tax=uncultured Litoreibacter sp. TaxID=1392394 RepID=UPI00262885F3|nr:MlaD family protein [uncultured Litoreibacter sp.]
MAKTPTEVKIEPARSGGVFSQVSFVWFIPLIALAIALGVAWQSYSNRGPVITIEFENGAGISKDETLLKYRDIAVGVVEDVSFTDGLGTVLATVRLDKNVAPYVDNGSTFWVVRPELTARGVSGLDTVLSGVFIEGSWDSEIGEAASEFRGLEDAPLFRPSKPGLEIALRATANGQLTENAPIFFRGIEVGRVGKARISPRTNYAIAEAIIYEPHGRLITASTRFWETSGFTVSIGASGAEIDFTSLATLISGGISFDTFVSGGERVPDGETFLINVDEETARNSVFNASEVETLQVNAIFDDNVSGLAVGAAVELSGLKIGEVQSVSGIVDRAQFGDGRVRLNATLAIQPAKLGLESTPSPAAALNFLAGRVREGFRARLTSASLLTGGLKVEFLQIEDAADAEFDMNAEIPQLPTTAGQITDAAGTVEGVITRINNLPIEELLDSAIGFLNAARTFVGNEDLQDAPAEVVGLLGDVRGLVTSDEIQNVPVVLNATLERIEKIVAQLEQEQLVTRLGKAVDAATVAAEGVDTAIVGLPALLTSVTALADKATALPAEELMEELARVAASADTLLKSEATQALPGDLSAALGEVESTLLALRQNGGLLENANKLLTSIEEEQLVQRLRDAVDQAGNAAKGVTSAAEGVPELLASFQAVADKAEALPVDTLVQELTDLAATADTVIGTDAFKALPADLSAALLEIEATLKAIREGGVIENANATLASARSAADAVAVAADDLPALMTRMSSVLNQASTTIRGFDKGEEISRDVEAALRDIQKAAKALASLAKTIERNPSSLVRGR